MPSLRLILGDQLNPHHSWFSGKETETVYLMAEMHQETTYVKHHAQKVLAIFAAMRRFAEHLRRHGFAVDYIQIGEPEARLPLPTLLTHRAHRHGVNQIQIQEPDEWRLDQQLRAWSAQSPIPVQWVDSEHFLTRRDEVAALYGSAQQWLMERFYRLMRKKHGVLMTASGAPIGGEWNLDHENRKPWKGTPPPPNDLRPSHNHANLWQEINRAGVQTFGEPQAAAFRWPVDRAEALQQWQRFLDEALPWFGDFEDAFHTEQPRLFHSMISFVLNTKMLKPLELIRDVEVAYDQGRVSLNAAEGFIRQILGWREYIRGFYWAQMPALIEANHFEHHTPLPAWFWTGQVKMACVRSAIQQSLQTAYAHHIQRLMVIGNFALLAQLNPQALHEWYLGVYIDAFEWVEAPNTLAMSQSATGQRLATKPYVSSAAYLHKMGNACSGCVYQRQLRYGDDACPFNALYWHFFVRHRDALSANPRLGMVYRQIERMGPEECAQIEAQAAIWLARLETL